VRNPERPPEGRPWENGKSADHYGRAYPPGHAMPSRLCAGLGSLPEERSWTGPSKRLQYRCAPK
jgi:hypothetical protein